MQLVRILDDEGFGVLAGELLAEVNTSRATDADPTTGEVDDIFTEFDAASASRAIQLEDAIRFLRLRLIEPARHLAEAERIAGVMQQGEPIKISLSMRKAMSVPAPPNTRRQVGKRLRTNWTPSSSAFETRLQLHRSDGTRS